MRAAGWVTIAFALGLGALTTISPALAVAIVAVVALLLLAMRDVSYLIVGTLFLHMAGERTGISYRSLSVGGINLFPNDLLTLSLVAALGVSWARRGRVPAWPKEATRLAVLAFLGYGILATVRGYGINGFAAVLGFRQQFFYGLLYLLSLEALAESRSRRRLFIGLLAAAVVVSLQGLFNLATGSPVGALTGSRTVRYLSGIQAMVLVFALVLLRAEIWTRRRPIWSILLGALFLIGIFLSQARSVWLGALLGVLAVGVMTVRSAKLPLRAALASLALVPLLAWGATHLKSLPVVSDIYTRVTSLERLEEDPTAIWRLVVWTEAVVSLRADPLFGLGLGQRFVYFDAVRGEWDRDSQLHNSYLELAYYTGIVGVGLLILFQSLVLAVTIRAARAARGSPQAARLAGLATCQICLAAVAFTNVIGASMVTTIFSWILAAVSMLEARAVVEGPALAPSGLEARG